MFSLLLKLGFRNIFRNGKRSAIIITTIAICCAIIIIIGGFYNHMFIGLEKEMIAMEGHLSINPNETLISDYKEIIKDIEQIDGVLLVSPSLTVSGIAGYDENAVIFNGEAVIYEHQDIIDKEILDKEPEIMKTNNETVEVGTILQKSLGVPNDEYINLLISHRGLIRGLSFQVEKGVDTASELLDRVYIKLPFYTVAEKLKIDSVESLKIYLTDESMLMDVQEKVLGILKTSGQNLGLDTFKTSGSYFESVINIYMDNYYFILVIIVITLLFAVGNTITMATMERVRELGTIRSFGTRKHHIVGMFSIEGFYLGLTGFISGILLSFLATIVINGLGGIYLPPPPTVERGFYAFITIPVSAILVAGAATITISILSSLFSTMKVNALTIIEELRHV